VRSAREAASVYILPPIWYDEYQGWFVKIGGGPNNFIQDDNEVSLSVAAGSDATDISSRDVAPEAGHQKHDGSCSSSSENCLTQEIEAWRDSTTGDPKQLEVLQKAMDAVFGTTQFLGWRVKNCITSCAGDEGLFQNAYYANTLFVVANCQGKAVMASAAIGDEVAAKVLASIDGSL